jgi:hypothetical protein
VKAAAEANPDRRIELWFMDEARVGQKGRVGFRWWARGERPRGLRQLGYEWAHLFGAVRPATGDGFALVLPEVSVVAMQAFLDRFAAGLAEGAHAVLVLDQAGWHGSRRLVVPSNVTLVPLPPYAPELNMEAVAALNTNFIKAKLTAIEQLGLNQKIEDILITLEQQVHLIRPLDKNREIFVYVALDKKAANLGMARRQLRELEANLEA